MDSLGRVAWWEESTPEDAARTMAELCQAIERAQGSRREQNLRHARLYANQDLTSIYDCGVAADVYAGNVYLTMNGVQSCVDTITAKISRSRPRVSFLTEKGNATLKTRAKKLTSFLDGIYHAADIYNSEGRQCFVDSTLFGSGVAYTDGNTDTREVEIERVLPDEILFDETEAMYGLRGLDNIFRKKYVHREVLLRRWGKTEELRTAIKGASGAMKPGAAYYHAAAGDMVPVFAGWHRASKPGAKDGKHLLVIGGDAGQPGSATVLGHREWRRARHPFSFFHWNRPIVGVWGRSLAEQLVPVQLKINEIIEVIDEGQRLMCVPKILVEGDSLDMHHFNNAVAEILKYTAGSAKPEIIIGKGASPEMYSSLERWWKHCFEVTGMSMLSATAEKPQGVTSAVALRELLDREDMRFSPVGQNWEQFFVDIGENAIDAADELYEDKKGLSVTVPGEKFIEKIDWKDVNLSRDQYVMKAFPTSTMPTTPAGKRQHAQELFEMGAIDRARFLELLDLPDTASATSLITASIENTERHLENILEHGKPQIPGEYSDLVIARVIAMQAYLRAENDDVPEKRLELLRRYIKQCSDMLAEKEAPPNQVQLRPNPAPGPVTPGPGLPVQPGAATAAPAPVPAQPQADVPIQAAA